MRCAAIAVLVVVLSTACGPQASVEAPEDAAAVQAALLAMKEERYEDVAATLAGPLARVPPSPDVQFIAGSAAYELGRWSEAVERLGDAVERKPEFLPSATALGFALRRLGDFPGARGVFARIVEARPGGHKAHYGLGLVALDEGRLDLARPALERALQISPAYLKARFAMARLLHEEGRAADARLALLAVLEVWPSHEEALWRLAQVCDELGLPDEATAALERRALVYAVKEEVAGLWQLVRGGDAAAETYLRIGSLLASLGETEDAARALILGLRRHAGDAQLGAALARLLPER